MADAVTVAGVAANAISGAGVAAVKICWDRVDMSHLNICMNGEALPADEIHLWAIDLAALSAGDKLSEAERRRARRIRDREKRDLYLGGRCGLRLLLSAYSGVANDALRFEYGARGKPKLAGGDLNFNYTLSGGKALYALVCRREIGVDLETLPREIAADLHANRNLSDAEKRAWNRLPTAHKNARDVSLLDAQGSLRKSARRRHSFLYESRYRLRGFRRAGLAITGRRTVRFRR